ncbi:hypothetical protein M9Y10_008404 [Tritrichomonas musculus]|uniref:F5/8 type C domain-containing protein n=1 Tax=Tritrichomonas musculus TaxID=1915356 RepID=A0ABR2J0F7_9EUKA
MQDMQPNMLPRRFSMPEDSNRAIENQPFPDSLIDSDFHSRERRNDEDGVVIPYTGEPFNGIIAFLSRSCHDNPAKQGLVAITGNSFNQGYVRILPHILDPRWKGTWNSLNEAGSYIQVDFLEHKINLTGYTIRTYDADPDWRHLRAWVVEGSNGSGWKEIHRVRFGGQLNGPNKVATFSCPNTNFYQIIRIKMTSQNYYGDWFFYISGLEFFGILD